MLKNLSYEKPLGEISPGGFVFGGPMYAVTRQIQWPVGQQVVEVSLGGLDYANPDMLTPRYPGEGETFHSPVEAAQAAIEICRAWRKDGEISARVAYGSTAGMSLPFEPCTFQELRDWAVRRYGEMIAELPACDRCGDPLWDPRAVWQLNAFPGDKFCSQRCAAYEAADVQEE